MNIGFAMCGSFCTFAQVFPVMAQLSETHTVIPIFSHVVCTTDSRFGKASDFIEMAERLCGMSPWNTIAQVEPIGPKKLLDALVIAPCTGNTLAKLAENIGRLMARRNIYFVPLGQDDSDKKPTSMVADFTQIPRALEYAMQGKQLQPILL